MAGNFFDQFDAVSSGNYFDQFDDPSKEPKRNAFARANDFMIDTANSAAGLVKSGVDLVAPESGASQAISDFMQSGRESQSDFKQFQRAKLQRDLGNADGELDKAGTYIKHAVTEDPLGTIAEGVGNILPFGVVGKGMQAAGLSEAARMAAGGGLGAALSAGEVRGNIWQKITETPDATLIAQSPEYAQLRESGMPEADAKLKIGADFTRNLPELLGTAAVGALSGKYGVEAMAAGVAPKMAANRAAAAGLGFAQEGAEGAVEQLASNYGVQRAVPSQSLTEDVGLNAAMEGLVGGVGGVAAGGHAAVHDDAIKRLAEAPDVDSAIQAANDYVSAPLALPAPAAKADWELVDGAAALPAPTALRQDGEGGGLTAESLPALPAPTSQTLMADMQGNVAPLPDVVRTDGLNRMAEAEIARDTERDAERGAFQAERQRKADLGLTPDVEQAQAARFAADEVQPGDLQTADQFPYGTKSGATLRARREGPEWGVAQVAGGWVVRKQELINAQPTNTRGTNADDVLRSGLAPVAPVSRQATDGRSDQLGRSGRTLGVDAVAPERVDRATEAPTASSRQAEPLADVGGVDAALTPADQAPVKNASPSAEAVSAPTALAFDQEPVKQPASAAGTFDDLVPKQSSRPPKPRMGESADDVWRSVTGIAGGVVERDNGSRITYPTLRVVGGDDFRLGIGNKLEIVDKKSGGAAVRDATPAEADEFHRDLEQDRVQVLLLTSPGFGSGYKAQRVVRELHSPSGLAFRGRTKSNGTNATAPQAQAAEAPTQTPAPAQEAVVPGAGSAADQAGLVTVTTPKTFQTKSGATLEARRSGGTVEQAADGKWAVRRDDVSALRDKWKGLPGASDERLIAQEEWDKAQRRVRAANDYRGTAESDIHSKAVEDFGGEGAIRKDPLGFTKELTRRLNAEADRSEALRATPGTMENAREARKAKQAQEASADAMQKAAAQDIDFNIARVRELRRQGRLTPEDAARLLEMAQSSTDAFDAAMNLEGFVSSKEVAGDVLPVGTRGEAANDVAKPYTTKSAATLAARKTGGTVEKVDGGWTVRSDDTPAMSRDPAPEEGTAQPERQTVKAQADTITATWENAPEVVVVDSLSDERVPKAVRDENDRQKSLGAKGEPEGVYVGGKVYLVGPQLKSAADVQRVLYHEALGHYGLRGLYGKELGPILDDVVKYHKAKVEAKAEQYGLDAASQKDMRIAAEEVLAELAQSRPELGVVKRALAAIRAFLRKAGFDIKMTDADLIANYILPARAFVEWRGRGGAVGAARFSRATTAGVEPDDVVEPVGFEPVHPPRDRALLQKLTDDMKARGWVGRPLLAWEDDSGGKWLLTGSHRYAAAKAAGVEVPVVYLADGTMDKMSDATGDSFDEIIGAGDDRLEDWLRNAGDERAADLMADEQNEKRAPDSGGVMFSRSYSPDQEAALRKAGAYGQAKLTIQQKAQKLTANLKTRAVQGIIDQFAPLKELDAKAYLLARMSKGGDGTLEAAMLYGRPYLRDGVPDVDVNEGGFAKVLADLKGEQDDFFFWVAAQRAERLKAEGKENLLDLPDIAALKTLNQGTMADGKSRSLVYGAALSKLNAFNESVLRMSLDSGLIDQAAYDLFKDTPYVPFYRLMEDGPSGPRFSSGLVNQKAWKKLKGGSQQLNEDLLANTLQNWSHLYTASAKNRAALASIDAAMKLGIAYPVQSGEKGSVAVMRDGVTEHYMIEDPYVMEAVTAMNYVSPEWIKPLAAFKRWLTIGVTANPVFKIKNLMRDSIAAVAVSDLGGNVLENVAKGWKATKRDSQSYASMLAAGGVLRFGTQLEGQRSSHAQALIDKMGGTVLNETSAKKLWRQVRDVWDAYQEVGDRGENVNRAALYDQLRAKGYDHAEASFAARDLMDFSMSGKAEAVRFLTSTVPFLNARIQGLAKLGRAAQENPQKFATVTGAVAMASLALMLAYEDDDDFKKREDWDRDTYWYWKIGDQAYRFPKPFEVGAIGTMAERTYELMFSKDMDTKRFGQRLSAMLFQTFAFNPTPQIIKPIMEVYANQDGFTGRAIEPMGLERLRPEDRRTENTTAVARFLGQLGLPDPGALMNARYEPLSPVQIDYLTRAYFGWVGATIVGAADAAIRPMEGKGERPDFTLKDLTGGFVANVNEETGSRYVTKFYNDLKQIEEAYASYRDAIKRGDVEGAKEIMEDEGDKISQHKKAEAIKKRLTEIGQRLKQVERDDQLSGEQKRQQIDELRTRRGLIAQAYGL